MEEFLKVLSSFAWGGCVSPFAMGTPRKAVVGHAHGDHLPVQVEELILARKIRGRYEDVLKSMGISINELPFFRWYRTHPDAGGTIDLKTTVSFLALAPKAIEHNLGIEKADLHTTPIVVDVSKRRRKKVDCLGRALYVDDFDLKDVPIIKEIIKRLKDLLKDTFRAVMIPLYSGARAHGADNPKELREASKDLIAFASEYVDYVVGLGHPIIPNWFYEMKKNTKNVELVPFPKTLTTVDQLVGIG